MAASVFKFLYLDRDPSANPGEASKRHQYSISSLNKSQLWMSSFDKFNDPYEVRFQHALAESLDEVKGGLEFLCFISPLQFEPAWRSLVKECGYDRQNIITRFNQNYIPSGLEKRLRTMFGAVSMATEFNSVLMWAHYCNQHTGICIEFDHEKLIANSPQLKCGSVNYVDSNKLPIYKAADFRKISLDETIKNIFTTKHQLWEYEQEWRLITVNPNSQLTFPDDAVIRVILGPFIDEKAEAQVREICGIKDWVVVQSGFSEDKYEITC